MIFRLCTDLNNINRKTSETDNEQMQLQPIHISILTAGIKKITVLPVIIVLFFSCTRKDDKPALFETLTDKDTGLDFVNQLTSASDFNLFKYLYFYNGAGIGAGDFNNDGKTDLFFSSNQQQNKLYLNKGNLKFEDVTREAKIPQDGNWSTGVSVVDINNDGFLDIYVCRVGNYDVLKSHNQFLICKGLDKNGIPVYEDKAAEMGLAFSGLSTQAAFLDYDLDGDLDMYLMNHSLRFTGTYNERKSYFNTFDTLTGDYIFRNDLSASGLPHFTDVTASSGILGFIIGYGLGIAVSDINLDGWPDIYIGNDFHENDYLYINQQNGTFKEALQDQIMHTSQFSMGVDVADITNDALPEIISLDMMPADPYILKRSLGEDEYNLSQFKIRHGYHPQFARNTLQLNRGNDLFSETGTYSNIFATDWSWASLFMDFDNDGWKDLFISNGIPKRMNDFDYINHVSSAEVQEKARNNRLSEADLALIEKFPQIKLRNKFYRNRKQADFEDMVAFIKNDKQTFSNGAVYADFDNDGDLDVVVNNINDAVLLYKNTTNDNHDKKSFAELKLNGPVQNRNATGAKLIIYAGDEIRTYEKFPVRGFQGSMETPLHIGLADTKTDSVILIWPDNSFERLTLKPDTINSVSYRKGLPQFSYNILKDRSSNTVANPVSDITAACDIYYRHEENPFNEFDREPLIPFMTSREGPAIAAGDVNGDGHEDFFVGSSKFKKSALFFQLPNGKFTQSHQPWLDADSTYEDVDAVIIDVNNDGKNDLILASGGNEFFGKSEYLLPRVYINHGGGTLIKKTDAFDNILMTASCVTLSDFTGDGVVDLFIGGRAVPWEYGKIPQSYLLKNDGTGKFTDVTSLYAPELSFAGFVKDADWADMDKDGDNDLILALEWGTITAFRNEKNRFSRLPLTDKKGWWNFTLPADIDGDGDLDLIAGNTGLNSRLKASPDKPVRLYYNDFDDNGKKEQLLTYYLDGREIPFASKDDLQKQIPMLKKKYLYAEDFARAELSDLFGKTKLKNAEILTADYFASVILVNDGNWNFLAKQLPWQAQLTPYRDAAVTDVNNDNRPDFLLAGNFYACNIQLGKYDADYGTVLVNKGGGNFSCEMLNGVTLKTEIRRIKNIRTGNKMAWLLAQNNDSLKMISFQ
jgi:hypothetical protein